ncbi:hypothetical protein FRB90_005324 [Tulasnella sp. 427]|nr:hypothetical protein FRB90_005324 [Tulasnella sp. 427]
MTRLTTAALLRNTSVELKLLSHLLRRRKDADANMQPNGCSTTNPTSDRNLVKTMVLSDPTTRADPSISRATITIRNSLLDTNTYPTSHLPHAPESKSLEMITSTKSRSGYSAAANASLKKPSLDA